MVICGLMLNIFVDVVDCIVILVNCCVLGLGLMV